jgi:uncharacterized protein
MARRRETATIAAMSASSATTAPVADADAVALAKEAALERRLAGLGGAMVAFSGGVDSSYLLAVAHGVLGERVTAVTADSPSLARASLATASAFCHQRGIRHHIVATDEFERAEYRANDGQRCFHCKSALFRAMDGLARATLAERGGEAEAGGGARPLALLLGAIAEDLHDHRPGMRAAAAAGALWPLGEAGFTKPEVRARARARGLACWDRPAEPCLSSRVPYGEAVTPEAVRMIEGAEAALHAHGFALCRARHHAIGRDAAGAARGWLCRIEVPEAELAKVLAARGTLLPALRALGYASVTLDLAGFASGGFNALLAGGERTASASAP